jgi:choline dehydrogenase-like flavoprotein
MIVDARSIPDGLEITADLCIIGAGAAGITIANELIGGPFQVALLESGGLKFQRDVQDLCQGTISGHPYYALDTCRLRFFGGSTNHWGGWCRPLDAIDFEERDWVPHSGWPFPKSHLTAEYDRARLVCGLEGMSFDPGDPGCPRVGFPLPDSPPRLEGAVIGIAPTRFGQTYRGALRRASNVRLFLHANALDLQFAECPRVVSRIEAATREGNRFSVSARAFLLAAGGIENARLLLASRRAHPSGVGNEHDLVGRFFTEHLEVPLGVIRPCAPLRRARPFGLQRSGRATWRPAVALDEAVLRRRHLLGLGAIFHDAEDPHDLMSFADQHPGYDSLGFVVRSLLRRELPDHFVHHLRTVLSDPLAVARRVRAKLAGPPGQVFLVVSKAEQAPNPENRVRLSEEDDRFGMPKVLLEWRLTDQDLESLREGRRVLMDDLSAAGLCDLQPEADIAAETIRGNCHHLGTTRMHRDPGRGVVDENCRVHASVNLYIAGNSVFPTAGWANPTLTMVALALRLADHLKHILRETTR